MQSLVIVCDLYNICKGFIEYEFVNYWTKRICLGNCFYFQNGVTTGSFYFDLTNLGFTTVRCVTILTEVPVQNDIVCFNILKAR